MNIIEAWKLAKDGQRIHRTDTVRREIRKSNDISFSGIIANHNICDEHLLADDWEIVKEKKKIETTWHSLTSHKLQCYPHDAKVVIEWDE